MTTFTLVSTKNQKVFYVLFIAHSMLFLRRIQSKNFLYKFQASGVQLCPGWKNIHFVTVLFLIRHESIL